MATAQRITVTGGPGRVNSNTVIKGQPFSASVTGLNGTPNEWSVGIGTVNGQNIFNTSSTSISNAVVSREISGNRAVISVGATNGNGVVRYLNVVEPCNARLFAFVEPCLGIIDANVSGATGATGFSWSISPSAPIFGSGSFVTFIGNPGTFYTISVNISGGTCNGETLTTSRLVRDCGDIFPFEAPTSTVSPNPSTNGEFDITTNKSLGSYKLSLYNVFGESVQNFSVSEGVKGKKLDASSLEEGIYLLKFTFEDGTAETKRIVIE